MSITRLTDQPTTADRARGITRLGHPRAFGTLIGAAGASSFVWGGKDALGFPWSTIAVLAWAAVMTAYLVWALALQRPFPPLQVGRRAGLTYLLSVLAMLVTINAGGRILVALDREPLAIAVSVVAVGAHFLPFARAFRTPMFAVLGWVPVPLGLVGLVLGWTVDPRAAATAAVLAGLAMLVIIVVDAHRPIGSIRGFTQGLRPAAD